MPIQMLFISLFVMLLIGVPVGFAIGGATILAMYFGTNLEMVISAQYCYSGISSFTVMAIPFFMLAGTIMSTGGIAKRIVSFASALIDFVSGALGCVTILASAFFGALCGSGMATTSAIGSMMIPEMEKRGYPLPYASTVVCFGGILGPIIPPSLSFVLYGAATGVAVPDLFLAGIFPGLLLALLFIVYNIVICKKRGIDIPSKSEEKIQVGEALKKRGKRLLSTTIDGIWALFSPLIILGGIYSGVFTPTEAACVSVVYSALVSLFVYRDMDLKGLYNTVLDSAILNGVTSFLLGYSTVFSTFMTFIQVPQDITNFLTTVSDNPNITLLFLNLILLVVGCFLDTVPAIIVMAPMLLPTIKQFGIDPIHFGVIMSINLALGLCSPPYGCNLFVGAAVAKIKMQEMFKDVIPFFIMGLIGLLLITYIPAISLALL